MFCAVLDNLFGHLRIHRETLTRPKEGGGLFLPDWIPNFGSILPEISAPELYPHSLGLGIYPLIIISLYYLVLVKTIVPYDR